MTFESVPQMLEEARASFVRLTAQEARLAAVEGAQLVDIRPEWQRRRTGEIAGAVVIERNHLEWRVHPSSDARLALASPSTRWVIYCEEGYSSSLAAASLVALGLEATDMIGGMRAWLEAGLPTTPGPTPLEQVVSD